jgi:hypothetical protein
MTAGRRFRMYAEPTQTDPVTDHYLLFHGWLLAIPHMKHWEQWRACNYVENAGWQQSAEAVANADASPYGNFETADQRWYGPDWLSLAHCS